MESANTGEESIVMQDHYRNSHLRHVRNTANRPLYQKLDVNAIGVDFDHQYDCISQEPSDNNQPYHGYLQLPEFNKENIESDSHDYLKLHGSVKTNQRPGTGDFDPINFDHKKDDSQIKNSNGSKRAGHVIALDSIRLNENIYTEIEETAFSSNEVEYTNRASKPITEQAVCLSWKQRCLLTLLLAVIAITMAIGTTIYILVTKDSQKELFTITTAITSTTEETISSSSKDQTTSFTIPPTQMSETVSSVLVPLFNRTAVTEEIQLNELSCTNILDAKLYFGPFAMVCVIPKFENFDYIGFYHEGGLNNSLFGILLNNDGSIYKTYEDNSDIEVNFETTSSIFKLMITFKNVSCAMDGLYSVALVRHVSNNLYEIITSARGHLRVTSQYEKPNLTLNADQVIDLIFPTNFYRVTGYHTCEGDVGYPTPSSLNIDIMYINGTSFQQIPDDHIYLNASRTFGVCRTMESLKFAIRFTDEMDGAKIRCNVAGLSDAYTSIENLTLIPRNICNCGGGADRGHPKNCKVQVLCIEDVDGTMFPRGIACSSGLCRNSLTGECSNNCSDAVCQEEVPKDFCTTPAPPTTTPIPTACQQAKPTLTLNADQVIDLIFPTNFYRDNGFHTCEGGVGYPTPSTLIIDIMYTNGTSFQQIPDDHIYRKASRTLGECQIMESLKFAIKFTEEMDGAKLRCSVANSSDDYTSIENLTLIPRNICNCGGGADRGHPKNCKVKVVCIEDVDGTMYPRGIACQNDLCRNSLTGDCLNNCSNAVCQEEVPQDFCTTPDPPTTTPIPSACNPGQPLITMHTDQIVDLGYYRVDRLHTCTGDVGVPSTHLIIELVYANGSEFQITGENIQSRQLQSGNCSNSETVKFGISFTSEMNGGKVRCSINGSSVNSTKNEIDLALIPRDICNCGKHSDTIGHPQSCYAYVLCEEIQGIIYPYGISCPSGECRNSITGICSANCSQAVCGETVPSGFCTTSAPMLPTVAPSQDIQCYGNSTFQFSGKVQMVCVLKQTDFTSMNVTFETTKQSNLIAQIASDRTVTMVDTRGKIYIQISSKTVTVELLNASCIDSGLYVVRVDFGSETAIAQSQLTMTTKPDKPSLEVPFHTVENENIKIICTGNTGNPAGSLQVLIKRLNVSDTITLSSDSVQVIQKPDICSHEETVTIEQKLTSEWNLTTITCQAVNQETITGEDDSIYYTSEESQIVLIEENYCSTREQYKSHPKSCYHYVWCTNDRMFPSQCPPPLCFFNATNPCSNCNEAPAPCTEP